jgi:hypothetical protein
MCRKADEFQCIAKPCKPITGAMGRVPVQGEVQASWLAESNKFQTHAGQMLSAQSKVAGAVRNPFVKICTIKLDTYE